MGTDDCFVDDEFVLGNNVKILSTSITIEFTPRVFSIRVFLKSFLKEISDDKLSM